jgi:hypothetical protein
VRFVYGEEPYCKPKSTFSCCLSQQFWSIHRLMFMTVRIIVRKKNVAQYRGRIYLSYYNVYYLLYEIVKLQRNAVYCDGHPSKHWPPLTLLNFNNIIIVLIFIEFFIIAVFYFVTFCNNSKKFVFLFKRAIYKLIHLYFCWPAWPGKNATQNTIYKAISIPITLS